jgi:hypothetical protein
MLPVILAAFLTIVGTGDNGSDNFVDCGPDEVSNTNFSAQENFNFDIGVLNQDELLLRGKHGDIDIIGSPVAASIMVSGTKRVLSESTGDAQEHLRQLQVHSEDLNTQALIETVQPECDLGRKYIVDYRITQPDFFQIRINNLGGVITIETVNDEVSVNNLSGDVTLTDITGSVAVNLLSGDIFTRILSLPLNGSIDLNILSGNISLEIPTSTSADFFARVSSGDINVTNLVLLNQVITPTSVSGTLGGGQGVIRLETDVIGDIDVTGF